MLTIMVTIMAMFGYFGGVNIKIYIVLDLIIAALIILGKVWFKIMEFFEKK